LDGIVASFTRFLFGIFGLIFGIARFDKSGIPEWLDEIL